MEEQNPGVCAATFIWKIADIISLSGEEQLIFPDTIVVIFYGHTTHTCLQSAITKQENVPYV
jgi:hypothetical protein